MKTPTTVVTSAVVAFALVAAPLSAWSCGLHGGVDPKAFSQAYPGSIGVALAVRGLIDQRQVKALPPAPAALGYVRVTQTLRLLQARLQAEGAQRPTALLLVEHGLWARWQGSGDSFQMQVHVDGPQEGDAVIVTGETVLTSLLEGRLSMAKAQGAGALAFGASDPVERESLVAVFNTPGTGRPSE